MGKVTGTVWIMNKEDAKVWVVAPFLACDLFPKCRPNDGWLTSDGGYIINKDEYPDLVEGEVVECNTQFCDQYPGEPELNPYGFIFNAKITKRLLNYFD